MFRSHLIAENKHVFKALDLMKFTALTTISNTRFRSFDMSLDTKTCLCCYGLYLDTQMYAVVASVVSDYLDHKHKSYSKNVKHLYLNTQKLYTLHAIYTN